MDEKQMRSAVIRWLNIRKGESEIEKSEIDRGIDAISHAL